MYNTKLFEQSVFDHFVCDATFTSLVRNVHVLTRRVGFLSPRLPSAHHRHRYYDIAEPSLLLLSTEHEDKGTVAPYQLQPHI